MKSVMIAIRSQETDETLIEELKMDIYALEDLKYHLTSVRNVQQDKYLILIKMSEYSKKKSTLPLMLPLLVEPSV